jgi:hypothetical protein
MIPKAAQAGLAAAVAQTIPRLSKAAQALQSVAVDLHHINLRHTMDRTVADCEDAAGALDELAKLLAGPDPVAGGARGPANIRVARFRAPSKRGSARISYVEVARKSENLVPA